MNNNSEKSTTNLPNQIQHEQEIKLIYFADKGRAEAARICFFIGNIEFEDERLSLQEFKEKKKHGHLLQNQLPVLYVNGVQFTQSGAIQRFAAKKADLYPTDEIQVLQTEQILMTIEEILTKLGTISNIKQMKRYSFSEEFINSYLPSQLSFLDNQLKHHDTGYYIEEQISLADIVSLSLVQLLQSGVLKDIPVTIVDQFEYLMQNYKLFREHPDIIRWEEYREQQYNKSQFKHESVDSEVYL